MSLAADSEQLVQADTDTVSRPPDGSEERSNNETSVIYHKKKKQLTTTTLNRTFKKLTQR